MENKLTYRFLVDLYLSVNKDKDKFLDYLFKLEAIKNTDKEVMLKVLVKEFLPHFKNRWQAVGRSSKRLNIRFNSWLNRTISLNRPRRDCKAAPGRPIKKFIDCSERTQRRKVKELCDEYPTDIISLAAAKSDQETHQDNVLCPDGAAALLVDAQLSKYQYELIRKTARDVGADIFPAYYKVLEAKKQCYPANITVSESSAECKLQDLLNCTIERLLLSKTLEEIENIPEGNLKLISKCGCDGSSGHSEYKQMLQSSNSDGCLFLISFVPLRLCTANGFVWQNPRPSSTRYCRPIKFEYKKETAESTVEEVTKMNEEISQLLPTNVQLHGKTFSVTHELLFTMVDGKVVQAVSGTASAATCVICDAKPKQMNDVVHARDRQINEDAYKYGLSTLHARIKLMECILHLAYNLPFKAWRVNDETKSIREDRKAKIQDQFKTKLGLKVDVVKQGFGTTNDGNTSRRFFADSKMTSEITNVDEQLIHRFGVILDAINCSDVIDPEKFGKYALDTANLFVEKYGWFYMPNTVHKVLLHGRDVMQYFVLPVGMLSEEVQETRNKDYRKFRLYNSCKSSRTRTNRDVLNMLLVSSDPYISSLRSRYPRRDDLPQNGDVVDLMFDIV